MNTERIQSLKPLRRILSPFQKFAHLEASGGILLIACTVIALALANSPWGDWYRALWKTTVVVGVGDFVISKDLLHWINDGLMAIFFFVVGLEIKREIRVGELGSPRQAVLPIAAALGGMVVPALAYVFFNPTGDALAGWGIPMATDIAFALGILALVGSRAPLTLKVFLTAVAIVDDIGAVLVIAIFYTEKLNFVALGWAAFFFALLVIANRLRLRTLPLYAFLGVFLWLAFLKSGIHATVAGILAASMIPIGTMINTRDFLNEAKNYLQAFEDAAEPETRVLLTKRQQIYIGALEERAELVQSPLQRLEHELHTWVIFAIMPIFALANAGVVLDARIAREITEPVFLGVFLGLLLGKQIGILGAAWLAVKTRLTFLPEGVSWRHMYGAACLAGVGFTMSLFIAGLALKDPTLLREAKMGILAASLTSAVVGWLVLRRAPVVENS